MPHIIQPLTVRIVYIVPHNADPWPEAKRRATECLEDLQWYFADEMSRHEYESKTFGIATDESGAIIFDQVDSSLRKEDFEKNYWSKCKTVAQAERLRSAGDIVIYVYEAYSITNGSVFATGARGTMNSGGGEAFLSSLHLKMARREWIANSNEYTGEIFDWISLEPMKMNTLSWNGRGRKLGDVSGSAFGVIAHELGHCFGLHHDGTNDHNRKGNLMGAGCRGMRGYFRPDLTDDFCVLTAIDASILDKNPFFSVRTLRPKSTAFP